MKSCGDVRRHGRRESGFYSISADGIKLFTVYCDLENNDSPWTVVQRRLYNSEPTDYHSKSWADYKNGFNSNEMNFWLGNSYIHEITKTPHRLKIVITTEEFNTYEAVYEDFTIKDETFGFQVNFASYSGQFTVSCLTVSFLFICGFTFLSANSMHTMYKISCSFSVIFGYCHY